MAFNGDYLKCYNWPTTPYFSNDFLLYHISKRLQTVLCSHKAHFMYNLPTQYRKKLLCYYFSVVLNLYQFLTCVFRILSFSNFTLY